MKKVIALALALVMVCTMAMAVTITVGTGAQNPDPSTTGPVDQILPGAKLNFTAAQLASAGSAPYVDAKTGEFVPANNKVTVTYGKGAELVKSAGWVRVAKAVDTNNDGKYDDDADKWQYQIVLKDNDTAVCKKDTVDFSIVKVSYKATTEKLVEYSVAEETLAKFERDYGYELAAPFVLDKATAEAATTGLSQLFPAENKLYTVQAGLDDNGDPLKTLTVKFSAANDDVSYTLAAGQKVLRKNIALVDTDTLEEKNDYNEDKDMDYVLVNDTNLTGTATVTNWGKNWNAYAVAADGKTVTKVPVVIEDGVATIKVPAYTTGIVYNGTLSGVTVAAPADVEVTNPGTGANDVVGVAAALAVVALVSGAAISLKK